MVITPYLYQKKIVNSLLASYFYKSYSKYKNHITLDFPIIKPYLGNFNFRFLHKSRVINSTKKYVIPITKNFCLSIKRVNYQWKDFYGVIKVSKSIVNNKVDLKDSELDGIVTNEVALKNSELKDLVFFKLEPLHDKPLVIRTLLKNPLVKLLTGHLFEFSKKPRATSFDLVAANLKISSSSNIISFNKSEEFLKRAKDLIYKLRRSLKRHRVRKLGAFNMNRNISTPNTPFGDTIKTLIYKLNDHKKMSRSARKRQNKLRRKKAIAYKNLIYGNIVKRIKEEKEKEKRKEIKKHEKFMKLEALIYLRELKALERCEEDDEPEKDHLKFIFNSKALQAEIKSLRNEIYKIE